MSSFLFAPEYVPAAFLPTLSLHSHGRQRIWPFPMLSSAATAPVLRQRSYLTLVSVLEILDGTLNPLGDQMPSSQPWYQPSAGDGGVL